MANFPGQGAPGGQAPIAPQTSKPGQMGIGPENFESVFALHRHDGTGSAGGFLYGPYFIRDSAGGNWKLVVSPAGVLSVVKA